MTISEIVNNQRNYFISYATYDVETRLKNLQKIKDLLFKYQKDLVDAFKKDYNKCEFDVVSNEFSLVIQEINYTLKHLKKISKAYKS